MSGLLRRIRRPSVASDEPPPEEAVDLREEADHGPVPAGADLDGVIGERPTTRRRGRLRRRLRHLRRIREMLLRDLGGFVFEMRRADEPGMGEAILEAKLERLHAVQAELRELEDILDDHTATVLREPGVGGTCPLCHELYGSDARFCSSCGTPVAPGAVRPVVSTTPTDLPARESMWPAVSQEPEPAPEPEPQPQPEPEPEPQPEEEPAAVAASTVEEHEVVAEEDLEEKPAAKKKRRR